MTPTHHLPGSKEKLEVLIQRHENGEELFHPDDNLELTDGRTTLSSFRMPTTHSLDSLDHIQIELLPDHILGDY